MHDNTGTFDTLYISTLLLHFSHKWSYSTVKFWNVQFRQVDVGWIEGEPHRKTELGVHQ